MGLWYHLRIKLTSVSPYLYEEPGINFWPVGPAREFSGCDFMLKFSGHALKMSQSNIRVKHKDSISNLQCRRKEEKETTFQVGSHSIVFEG